MEFFFYIFIQDFFFTNWFPNLLGLMTAQDIAKRLSAEFWTIVSRCNCSKHAGKSSILFEHDNGPYQVNKAFAVWMTFKASERVEGWLSGFKFFQERGEKNQWVMEKNGLLVYCTSTHNNTSYSSHFYWIKVFKGKWDRHTDCDHPHT